MGARVSHLNVQAAGRALAWASISGLCAPRIREAGLREGAVRVPTRTFRRDVGRRQWPSSQQSAALVARSWVASGRAGGCAPLRTPPPASVATWPFPPPLKVTVRTRWFHESATYSLEPSALASTSARGRGRGRRSAAAGRRAGGGARTAPAGESVGGAASPEGKWKVASRRGPSAWPTWPAPAMVVTSAVSSWTARMRWLLLSACGAAGRARGRGCERWLRPCVALAQAGREPAVVTHHEEHCPVV